MDALENTLEDNRVLWVVLKDIGLNLVIVNDFI